MAAQHDFTVRYRYEVTAHAADPDVIERFNRWMIEEHGNDLIACDGCLEYRLLGIDAHTSRAEYIFASKAAFERYEREDAPRLRARGLQYFEGMEISFSRSCAFLLAEARS